MHKEHSPRVTNEESRHRPVKDFNKRFKAIPAYKRWGLFASAIIAGLAFHDTSLAKEIPEYIPLKPGQEQVLENLTGRNSRGWSSDFRIEMPIDCDGQATPCIISVGNTHLTSGGKGKIEFGIRETINNVQQANKPLIDEIVNRSGISCIHSEGIVSTKTMPEIRSKLTGYKSLIESLIKAPLEKYETVLLLNQYINSINIEDPYTYHYLGNEYIGLLRKFKNDLDEIDSRDQQIQKVKENIEKKLKDVLNYRMKAGDPNQYLVGYDFVMYMDEAIPNLCRSEDAHLNEKGYKAAVNYEYSKYRFKNTDPKDPDYSKVKSRYEFAKKHFEEDTLHQREKKAVEKISAGHQKKTDRVYVTYFGAFHDFREEIQEYNYNNPQQQFGYISITPNLSFQFIED